MRKNKLLFLYITFFSYLISTGNAWANGWEHFTIPIENILRDLDSDSAEVRSKAGNQLGIRKEKIAIPKILEALSREGITTQERKAFYASLGEIGDNRATTALVEALDNEVSPVLRAEAATALGQLTDSRINQILLESFEKDASKMVRLRIVDGLGKLGDQAAIPTLVGILDDEDKDLKVRAIRSLGRLKSQVSVSSLNSLLLNTKDKKIQGEIIDSIGAIGHRSSMSVLKVFLPKINDKFLRLRTILAIGQIKDGDSSKILNELLEDPSLDVIDFAINGIKKNKFKSSRLPLNKLFKSLHNRLWSLDTEEILNNHLFTAKVLKIQTMIVETLNEIDPINSVDTFSLGSQPKMIASHSAHSFKINDLIYELRRISIVALGYTANPDAAKFVIENKYTHDPDSRIRAAAIRTLGVLQDLSSINYIIDGLTDDSYLVRLQSAVVLGRLRVDKAKAPLRLLLSDRHELVRWEAITALMYLKDEKSLNIIKTIRQTDPSQRVRTAADRFVDFFS